MESRNIRNCFRVCSVWLVYITAGATCCGGPTGETSAAVGRYLITISAFRQTDVPNIANCNINGLLVQERTIYAGANECYYSGAPFPPKSTVSGGTWTIGGSDPNGIASNGSDQWGTDLDGDTTGLIGDIRQHAKTPCTDHVPQTMVSQTVCNKGIGDPYYFNVQTVTIDPKFVENCRSGKCDRVEY